MWCLRPWACLTSLKIRSFGVAGTLSLFSSKYIFLHSSFSWTAPLISTVQCWALFQLRSTPKYFKSLHSSNKVQPVHCLSQIKVIKQICSSCWPPVLISRSTKKGTLLFRTRSRHWETKIPKSKVSNNRVGSFLSSARWTWRLCFYWAWFRKKQLIPKRRYFSLRNLKIETQLKSEKMHPKLLDFPLSFFSTQIWKRQNFVVSPFPSRFMQDFLTYVVSLIQCSSN